MKKLLLGRSALNALRTMEGDDLLESGEVAGGIEKVLPPSIFHVRVVEGMFEELAHGNSAAHVTDADTSEASGVPFHPAIYAVDTRINW